MNIGKLVLKSTEKYGEKPAIKFENICYSYSVLNERVNCLSNALLRLGIKKGDRVAVLASNSHKYIETDFAMAKCGIIRVPLKARLTPNELLHIINDSKPKAMFVDESSFNNIELLYKKLKYLKNYVTLSGNYKDMIDYEELISSGTKDEPGIDVYEDDIYALIYTSGTTGTPKGAIQTHRAILWVIKSILHDVWCFTDRDVLLTLLPLMFAPIIFILPAFISGTRHVIMPRFNVIDVLKKIQKERVTIMFMVPTVIYMLLEYAQLSKYDLSSIHTILYGGSPIIAERMMEAIKIFGNVFIQAYGLAEAFMPITILTKDDHLKAKTKRNSNILNSAGKESTFAELKIVDNDGNRAATNNSGEIVLKGDNLMKGYWNNIKTTKEAFKNGWFYTGDIGRVDEEGYIHIVDRKNEMIITGGLNVYPREIEEVLFRHPAVLEAVAIGVPNKKWGESVKAVVVLKNGIELNELDLQEFCRGKIADYKIPKTIDFVLDLPKSESEKIMRKKVKEKYWDHINRRVN